jgi:NADPH-dependent 2,4-dienoyl-CoA reductase/sulfur reductase-like enzyme
MGSAVEPRASESPTGEREGSDGGDGGQIADERTEGIPGAPTRSGRPRIVIVGAGFGGIAAARGLAHVDADVTVIDRTNHFLFQPMLYQVATASLAETAYSGRK